MTKKILLIMLILAFSLSLVSCGSSNGDKSYSTDGLKQFFINSKKNQKISGEQTKKGYKSIFPNYKTK